MRRLRQVALGILVLVSLSPGVALAQAYPYTWTWDDFVSFDVGQPGDPSAKWFHGQAGWYVAADATVTPWGWGMHAKSPGTNPHTNRPAFTQTLAPDWGIPGQFDHMKWVTYMNHFSSLGKPGFDAVDGMELACETWISGETYGTEFHPFDESIVVNPQTDLRLAAFAMNTFDSESGLAFDFFFTNHMVYAVYERLPYARGDWGYYAAFTYAIPVAQNNPWTWHVAKISYDRSANVVRWFLNGQQVFQVTSPGTTHIDRQYMILDHGGWDQGVVMNQLNCGMGMFTMLDAVRPQYYPQAFVTGPVRLNTTEDNFYFNPAYGQWGEWPWTGFVDSWSQHESRLFGQGAEMSVGGYQVTNTQL